jgi:hypothetical protein
MKRLHFYAMAMLLLVAIVGTQQAVSSQPAPATATIYVRVFYGQQWGAKQLDGPCSAIRIIATPQNGPPIAKLASGPTSGAKAGQCTASLKVPANVPVVLTAEYAGFYSEPDDSYGPPAGKWTNPLTLKPGETVMKYIKVDGKP